MKTNRRSSLSKSLALLGLAFTALAGSSNASTFELPLWGTAGINLGNAGQASQWSILALTGGVTLADTTGSIGNPTVSGDIGVAHFGSSVTATGNAYLTGTAKIHSGGTLSKSGAATITAQIGGSANPLVDPLLDSTFTPAANAAAQAASLAPTSFSNLTASGFSLGSSINLGSGSYSLSASAATGGPIVLNLSSFTLGSGAEFTLIGTAHMAYIINVSGAFSLTNGKVLLSGGIDPGDVLFNITGTGSTVALSSSSQFNGLLLAPSRAASLSSGAKFNGTLIAGSVSVAGGAKVTKPVYVSP